MNAAGLTTIPFLPMWRPMGRGAEEASGRRAPLARFWKTIVGPYVWPQALSGALISATARLAVGGACAIGERSLGSASENDRIGRLFQLGTAPRQATVSWMLGATQSDWPVVRRLSALAFPRRAHEPPAFEVLRRLPMSQVQPILRSLGRLPEVAGAGEPIPLRIRRPLEVMVGRDLAEVQLHTARIAAELSAEAFTTGRHVVFAPGRRDLHSARGVALLAHEVKSCRRDARVQAIARV